MASLRSRTVVRQFSVGYAGHKCSLVCLFVCLFLENKKKTKTMIFAVESNGWFQIIKIYTCLRR